MSKTRAQGPFRVGDLVRMKATGSLVLLLRAGEPSEKRFKPIWIGQLVQPGPGSARDAGEIIEFLSDLSIAADLVSRPKSPGKEGAL